jgi:hypothetical protein
MAGVAAHRVESIHTQGYFRSLLCAWILIGMRCLFRAVGSVVPALVLTACGGGSGAASNGIASKSPEASGQLGALAGFTDLKKLFNQLLSSHGTLVKGPITTARGMKAVPLTDRTKGGTLYVAATGKPYPIEVVNGGADNGQITFDRFNQPVSLTPPAGAIDMSQLQSQ